MTQIERLVGIMARLRDPEHGCAWDLAQRFETIAPYTIEEAYEVDDAIRSGDRAALCNELGDLLLQVVYHARMADEEGAFGLEDVARAINDKLVRRHPHVFGDADPAEVSWEALKEAERGADASAMDDVPRGLPALLRAQKLQRRAERAGLHEPLPAKDIRLTEAALGSQLFALASAARAAGLDAELALREENARFESAIRAQERDPA